MATPIDFLITELAAAEVGFETQAAQDDGDLIVVLKPTRSGCDTFAVRINGPWAFASIDDYANGFEFDLEDEADRHEMVALALAIAQGSATIKVASGRGRPVVLEIVLPEGTRLKPSVTPFSWLRPYDITHPRPW